MKENFKLGIILFLITSIAGALLGVTYDATKEAIAAQSMLSVTDLQQIIPEAESVKENEIKIEEDSNILEVLDAYSGDTKVATMIKVVGKGFHGDVEILVGIDEEDNLRGIKVLAHSETPGVGSKIEKEDFYTQFKDKTTESLFQVVKVEPSSDSEIQGVSGATVSSNCVTNSVNEAMQFYFSDIKKSGKGFEEVDNTSGASESN